MSSGASPAPFFRRRDCCYPLTQQVRLRDYREPLVRKVETMEEGGEGEARARPFGEEGFKIGDGETASPAPGQRFPEELPASRRFSADQDPLRGVVPGEKDF